MKTAYFKRIAPIMLCMSVGYANDFTQFPQDNAAGYLQPLSTAQQQTDIAISRSEPIQPKKDMQTLSLLKKANKERNGFYIMTSINMIPLQRILNNEPSYTYAMGMGVRGGIISYLDEYIGIRGYFAFDFTNDNLSPIRTQANAYNGTFLMASLGLDIMIDFFIDKSYKNTIGFFAGVGAGAFLYCDFTTPIHIPTSQDITNYMVGGNVMVQGGLSALFNYHHRIEVGMRFLPTQSLRVESDGLVADYNPYIGYSYVF